MCYICWSESTKIFCTNDFICRAIWRHLSFLPYQFSIFYDVGGCVLVAVVWKRWTTPNNTQQHATGWKNVTQHVTPWKTLRVVSTCWPAMLRPFTLCSGLSKWQAINSLPKSRRVRTPSRKKNTCGSILVTKHLIFAFGEVAYGKFESILVCDYRRRNEERRPGTYSRIYNSMIQEDYMS